MSFDWKVLHGIPALLRSAPYRTSWQHFKASLLEDFSKHGEQKKPSMTNPFVAYCG